MVFMDLWLTVWVGAAEQTEGSETLSDKENTFYSGIYIGESQLCSR
jgi:hypothetical protein